MDALPEFRIVTPRTVEEAIAARADNPQALPLGGGTDLVVNIRRGIVAPPVLIDMTRVQELHGIKADEKSIRLGASVTLSEIAAHPAINTHYPVVAQAAGHIAGPTHRNMGTVGGNLCLDTRCIFYNQSEWWRDANNHCLKTTGTICHVAPKSRGVCFATFSGDLAPALLTLGAEVDIAGPTGKRTIPLEKLYIGFARQDVPVTETQGDGKYYLSLRKGELVTAVRANNTAGLRSAYDKIRIRRSIEYPVAGVAVKWNTSPGVNDVLHVEPQSISPPLLVTFPLPAPEMRTESLGETTVRGTGLLVTPEIVMRTSRAPNAASGAICKVAAADVGLCTATSVNVAPVPALIVMPAAKLYPVNVTDMMAPCPTFAGTMEVSADASVKSILEVVAAKVTGIGAPAVTSHDTQAPPP